VQCGLDLDLVQFLQGDLLNCFGVFETLLLIKN